MKRYLLFIITGLALLWSTTSRAVYDGTLGSDNGINPNPHNLSSLNNLPGNKQMAVTETQICIFCHTPHGARPDSPLWGRPDPQGTFFTFDSAHVQDTAGKILGIDDPGIIGDTLYDANSGDYPNGASKLCLSCHDGVTALGVLVSHDIEMDPAGTGFAVKAIDLTVSHPISFVYNATVQGYLNGLGKADSYSLPPAGYLDDAFRVQCTICHQPHKDTKAINTLPFWRNEITPANTAYSTVCTKCHKTSYTSAQFPDHNYP